LLFEGRSATAVVLAARWATEASPTTFVAHQGHKALTLVANLAHCGTNSSSRDTNEALLNHRVSSQPGCSQMEVSDKTGERSPMLAPSSILLSLFNNVAAPSGSTIKIKFRPFSGMQEGAISTTPEKEHEVGETKSPSFFEPTKRNKGASEAHSRRSSQEKAPFLLSKGAVGWLDPSRPPTHGVQTDVFGIIFLLRGGRPRFVHDCGCRSERAASEGKACAKSRFFRAE
jgi:hypothetical protein